MLRDDQPVAAQPRAIALIRFLAERPGTVVSREALLAGVWPDVHVSDDALHQMLKRARVALGDDPAAPRYIETVHRRGWRFAAPVEIGAAPAAPEDLFGREALLAEVLETLRAGPGLVTLHGPGGVGKTRLSRAIALAWGGPVRFVELVALRDRVGVVEALASALRLQLGSVPVDAISAVCRAQLVALGEALLVLDNAEQLDPGWLQDLEAWAAPRLRVLVTSRHRLGLPTERVVEVPPLDGAAARKLWEAVAGGPCADPALGALLSRLDHLPLAIRLAASRARLLGPTELLRRTDAELQRLVAAPRGEAEPGRHDSVSLVMAASWELLPAEARRDLSRLSVIEGDFDLSEATALLGPDALDRLEGLELRALVQVHAEPGGARFRLLELVRGYAASRGAAEAAEAAMVWDAAVVSEAESLFHRFRRHGEPEVLGRLVQRLPALHRAREREGAPPERVVRAAGLAARVQDWTGPAREALPWLDDASRLLDQVPARARAIFQLHSSLVALATGDLSRCIALAQEAAASLPASASFEDRCTVLSWLAGQISARGRESEAITTLEPLLAEAERRGERYLAMQAAAQLANANYRAGRLVEAVAIGRRALELGEQEGAHYLLPWVQCNLALYLVLSNHFVEAEALLQRAAALSRAAGRIERETLALCQLTQLALYAGWPEQTRRLAETVLASATLLRSTFNASVAVAALASMAVLDGDLVEARALFSRALLDFGQMRGDHFRGVVSAHLAMICLLEGDTVAARALLAAALGLIHPLRGAEDLVTAQALLALAGDTALGDELPHSYHFVHIADLLEAAHAALALRADRGSAPAARQVLARLTEARPPERPPAARWVEVAVGARLLARELAALSS